MLSQRTSRSLSLRSFVTALLVASRPARSEEAAATMSGIVLCGRARGGGEVCVHLWREQGSAVTAV